MITDINSEDRLVQTTFADYLRDELQWESVYAYNKETFGATGMLGRNSERDIVLMPQLRNAITALNPHLPPNAVEEAVQKITGYDFVRSTLQHNREFYRWIRDGVPVEYRDKSNELCSGHAKVINFQEPHQNRFMAVRELKIQGLRMPHYNRRADLVCFVNGLPVVFIELKAVYRNIRAGYDGNLTDYFDTIPHAFFHNAFLIVSNGDHAKYGSITSKWEHFHEWKRKDEKDKGSLEARVLLDGMLAKDRLLDFLENFILFDDSKPGGTRKVVARNHQVLGVNNAVAAVMHQEELKKQIPPEQRLVYRVARIESKHDEDQFGKQYLISDDAVTKERRRTVLELPLVERAHPDLGRLGVFWHTQGSGKSYSMTFFSEKVRRVVPGNFTFVILTDRDDLDDQIYRTFVGCGIANEKTPRVSSSVDLERRLSEDHRFVFSLMQKFRREVDLHKPYSKRDDIIVISDEAHRTQAGRLARHMRLALPNAAFIGFTGTPLFKQDHLTRRIFGNYVSRYDFDRAEKDGATVRLVYENRGEKLGITRLDLNDRIAEKIEEAELDQDQVAQLEQLLGKDYEVITADDRLDKVADDFVDRCSARWQTGKSMMVCIDKITCARMYKRIIPRWQSKIVELDATIQERQTALAKETDSDAREKLQKDLEGLQLRVAWMLETIIDIIISEGQNEVRDFNKWDFDIRPHRDRIKRGFETPDGKRIDVETAFKDPEHPFRVAIVCAMWLTGFDVECLATLYIDKPMKTHTLMQAIARANRVFPGKACGVIADYNGMLKSLREALALYALGDEEGDTGGEGEGYGGEKGDAVVAPIEELLVSLIDAIDATEQHLAQLGFDSRRLIGAKGFARIEAMRDAVDALYTSDEAKRRFEILARQVFARFTALIMEPSAFAYVVQRDNIEAIYKKLEERRDTADVTEVLKELHRIVNAAISTQGPGDDHADELVVDLSTIDFEKLRDEFARKVRHKQSTVQDIRVVVEQKLRAMLARNPERMDYYKRYQEIVADYNREKDRVTVEETFRRLMELANNLDAEQRRAVSEGLTEDELALFDLMAKENLAKTERERLKQSSRALLARTQEQLATMKYWTLNAQTQADVQVFILDQLYSLLPRPPYTDEETDRLASEIYSFVLERTLGGCPIGTVTAA